MRIRFPKGRANQLLAVVALGSRGLDHLPSGQCAAREFLHRTQINQRLPLVRRRLAARIQVIRVVGHLKHFAVFATLENRRPQSRRIVRLREDDARRDNRDERDAHARSSHDDPSTRVGPAIGIIVSLGALFYFFPKDALDVRDVLATRDSREHGWSDNARLFSITLSSPSRRDEDLKQTESERTIGEIEIRRDSHRLTKTRVTDAR